MKNTRKFCSLEAPFIASIVQESTVAATIANILNSEHDGAMGFMVDFSFLPEEGRTEEAMRRIFAASGRPMMPLFYRSGNLTLDLASEDDRAELMLRALKAGARSIDVMGNLFEPDAPRELAKDRYAVDRQMALIDRIHEAGGEVLISSHMAEVLRAEEVLEHLLKQERRGADIAKIVTFCETEDDLEESVRTMNLLKREMKLPYIYLCNGKFGRLQRFWAPVLGGMLNFGIERYNPISQGAQPTIKAAVAALHEMTWHMDV